METQISVVFSWDPRARSWVKERGPVDAAPPPAAPIDNGAVQTYFLDPQNGRWTSTVLGLRARQLSEEVPDAHRAPMMSGLAVGETAEKAPGPAGLMRSGAPIAAGVVVLLLLAAAAVIGSQIVLGPMLPAAAATAAPTVAATAPVVVPTEAPAPETPAPTPVPTVRPPQTIRLSVRLTTGTSIVYSGPSAITRGANLGATFSVVNPVGAYESLTIYFGNPDVAGGMTQAFARPDANGNLVVSISSLIPRGDQPLRVQYGTVKGIYTLGTISVR